MVDDGFGGSLYNELRLVAAKHMARERRDHTLQPTALANEAFLVLTRQHGLDATDRTRFMAAAANIIRRILIDHARRYRAEKRGGKQARQVSLHGCFRDFADEIDVLALNHALVALAEKSERAARVVELKFFGGMSGDEIATELDVSLRTVSSDWKFAKAWLYRQMADRSGEEQLP